MNTETLHVGAAMGNITPQDPLPNYYHVLHHRGEPDADLLCHALYLRAGGAEWALVSCDTTFIDRTVLLRIRDEAGRKAKIPAERIWVAATHDHTAPTMGVSFLAGTLPDPVYLDMAIDRIVKAIVEAKRAAQPAVLVAGMTAAPGYELNRRTLRADGGVHVLRWQKELPVEGPVNQRMGFIGFETPAGEPLSLIVNHACHNNICGQDHTFHRDLFGRAGDALRARFPSLLSTPFLPAPCGDTVCGDPQTMSLERGDAAARRIGQRITEIIAAGYRAAPRQHIDHFAFASTVLDLPDRPLAESTFCHDGCRGTDEAALAFARKRYDPEEKAVAARGETFCPVEIAALALGDAALVTNPAELFAVFGIEIQQRSPFATTLVSELTNGYCGYVPTEEAFAHGGYETHRTLYTSRLAQDAGRRITEESLTLLNEVHRCPKK